MTRLFGMIVALSLAFVGSPAIASTAHGSVIWTLQ
jgi:hypothetical protein